MSWPEIEAAADQVLSRNRQANDADRRRIVNADVCGVIGLCCWVVAAVLFVVRIAHMKPQPVAHEGLVRPKTRTIVFPGNMLVLDDSASTWA